MRYSAAAIGGACVCRRALQKKTAPGRLPSAAIKLRRWRGPVRAESRDGPGISTAHGSAYLRCLPIRRGKSGAGKERLPPAASHLRSAGARVHVIRSVNKSKHFILPLLLSSPLSPVALITASTMRSCPLLVMILSLLPCPLRMHVHNRACSCVFSDGGTAARASRPAVSSAQARLSAGLLLARTLTSSDLLPHSTRTLFSLLEPPPPPHRSR